MTEGRIVGHPNPNELNGTERESQHCDSGKDQDKPDGVPIKLESNGLWEQHRSDERTLGCVETRPRNDGRRRPQLSIRRHVAANTNNLGTAIKEHFRILRLLLSPMIEIFILRGNFADRHTLACKHALVDDSVSGKQEHVGRDEGKLRR